MKALKTGLVIAVTVLFYIACSSPQTTNQNANLNANQPATAQPANTNSAPPATPAPTDTASQANANATRTDDKPAPKADPVPGVNAAALFEEQKCALCHGVDGKGKAKGTPDFTNAEWQKKHSNDDVIEQIKNGEPPKMPAYKGKLSDTQIKALVGYIRAFAK